jgi:hypothetical protein
MQQTDACKAATTQCDRERYIKQDLARVEPHPWFAPWRPYRTALSMPVLRIVATNSNRQPGSLPATASGRDTRIGPDTLLHLESASFMRRPGT